MAEEDNGLDYQNEEHLKTIKGIGKKYAESLSKGLRDMNIKTEKELRKHMGEHEEKGTKIIGNTRLHGVVAKHLEGRAASETPGPQQVIQPVVNVKKPAQVIAPVENVEVEEKSPAPEPEGPTPEAKAAGKQAESTENVAGAIEKAGKTLGNAVKNLKDSISGGEGGGGKGGASEEGGTTTRPTSSPPATRKISGGWLVFILAIGVWILDYFSGFNGIRADIFIGRVTLGAWNLRAPGIPLFARETLWRLFINPIIWIPIISYALIKGKWKNVRGRIGDLASFMAMIYVPAAIFLLGGFNGVGLAHLGIAGAFYIVILTKSYGKDNIPRARWVLVICLLIDFFGYGIAREVFLNVGYLTNRVIVPFWVYISLWYIHIGNEESSKSRRLSSTLWIILISANLFILVTATPIAAIDLSQAVGPEQAQEAIEAAKTGMDNFKIWVNQLFTDIKRSATQQLEYATGGYYKGKVEENEKEQLGVYLENIEAADKSFYENEQVIVWGDLEAKTLDQPVYIYMSCESGDAKGEIVPKRLANQEEGYKIEQLEQIGFECRFKPGLLKTGTNNIEIKAEFNFETLAFLKTYFMDIERIRALRRENINPLTQYGIKDKTPTAVFTNGPVKLGMGTVDPPVGVNAEDSAYSYIGVTIERQWLGKIKNITELTIQVPNVLEVESSDGLFCRDDFKKTGENEEGYAIYTLTEDSIKKIKTPITQFRSWRCPITVPKASEVLGKTPVTSYYYRANAKYVYEVEKPISVFVKSVPQESTKLASCDVNCTDSDGCICDADGCNIAKGSKVSKGFTCNNYKAASTYSKRDIEEDFEYIDVIGQYIGAMIILNEKCLRNETVDINEAIDNDEDLNENEKEELKDAVMSGCEERSYRFFEITESLIVDKVKSGVDIFNVLESKDLGDEKAKANDKKGELDTLLEKVIVHFRDNYNYVKTGKNEDNIRLIGAKREELNDISFD